MITRTRLALSLERIADDIERNIGDEDYHVIRVISNALRWESSNLTAEEIEQDLKSKT